MSEEIKPVVTEEPADVVKVEQETPVVNYAEKNLAELTELFQQLTESEDRMKRSKEADAIKSAFYKRLSKEKAEAGEDAAVQEPDDNTPIEETTVPLQSGPVSPFAAIEAGFKALYMAYKKERAEYNKQLDAEREENLAKKQAIIEELKALVEEPGQMKDAFPHFRDIQNRWRETGPVPQQNFRDINDTYQLYVTKFYDLVDINRELRDLDFKKNLEAKTAYCESAEALAEEEDVVEAFKELQKLHEQWKDLGARGQGIPRGNLGALPRRHLRYQQALPGAFRGPESSANGEPGQEGSPLRKGRSHCSPGNYIVQRMERFK